MIDIINHLVKRIDYNMNLTELRKIKRKITKETNTVEISLPNNFSFKDHNIYDFNNVISFFNWIFIISK